MKLIEKRRSGKLATWVYEDESLQSAESAAERIACAAALEGFAAKYIALRDLKHSADEDNNSRELKADAGPNEILAALTATPCDRLFLSGEYLGVRAGIGIDLKDFGLSITMPDDRPDVPESLAGLLAGDTF